MRNHNRNGEAVCDYDEWSVCGVGIFGYDNRASRYIYCPGRRALQSD